MYQSYLGGTPENGYAEYSYDNSLDLIKVEGDDAWTTVTFRSGGKDLPVSTSLKKNKRGRWKIFEYSSLITGVKDVVDDGDW